MFKKVKKSLALEINDNNIKVLEISLISGEKTISASNEVSLDAGIVVGGVIKKPKDLARQLKIAFNQAKPRAVSCKELHFALPDQLVYTHVFRTAIGAGQGIKQVVAREYQKSIPLTESEGEFSFKVIDKNESSDQAQISTIILVAAAKKSLLAWQNFLEEQKLNIEFFDIDALAIFRAMFKRHQDRTLGILDIKQTYSKFSIFSLHGLEYEFSIAIGENHLVTDKDLSLEEKNDNLELLLSDIEKNISYATDLMMRGDNKNPLINEIILSGEGSNISALTKYLEKFWPSYKFKLGQFTEISDNLDRKYIQVFGLAMRSWSHVWEKSDPFLSCIGHSYSLETKSSGERFINIDISTVFKKYILIPVLILVFISFAWWFMGAISTSVDSDSIQEEELVQEELLTEPILDQVVIEELDIFVIVNEIGGPLNVRQGPGTDNPVIASVNSGSEQVLLEEKDGWYRIEWPNEDNAWISAAYATKVD